jgi:(1->4)-alpha-D-glucan 1-alpha-D-glucosylmutase
VAINQAAKHIPRATYRLQFRKEFGFDDAAALAPYLAELGVSHVYASPYLKARPGSTHGYDIVDHNALNLELGSAESFDRMVAAFRQHGLGQILDFVPNHMGVGGSDNAKWLDVLEWGEGSEFSEWFDIEWQPDRNFLKGKLLVPLLSDQYGAVLESGALQLRFDADDGGLAVWAYDTHKLPLCPRHYALIIDTEHPSAARLADAFAQLPEGGGGSDRRAQPLKSELARLVKADASARAAIDRAVAGFNGQSGDLASWSKLDDLIKEQAWRPAHFRVAADDINYRRFFNINELAGIRVEIPKVFDEVHKLVFRLLEEGVVDGLRLDHIDGLFDPKRYCRRLREKAPRPFYLLVEKILAAHESLRDDWETDGTTGYEFANLVTGLLIDPRGEEAVTAIYADFTGEKRSFGEIVRECKLRVMEDDMASELNVLAREAARLARSNPHTQDFTNNVLRRALKEIVACFPVYRTYVDAEQTTDADRRDIDWAVAQARRRGTALDPSVFDFLHKALSGDLTLDGGFNHSTVTHLAMRFQQYSGPVMAKGLEDTAFYRYNRFLAVNEVGGSPEKFGVSVAQFHAANLQRLRRTPQAFLSTSTHDTKRGEDTRARLAVLSEFPDEWAARVTAWSRILRAPEAGSGESPPPSRNDEYAFYQLLLAAWPPELFGALDEAALGAFRQRIEVAVLKSLREAKVYTTWAAPDAAYESAVLAFVRRALDCSRNNPFLENFTEFLGKVAPFGVANSLVQTALKFTVPGVPDIYQGAELWDFSLVDPDNRRPVDYEARAALLNQRDPRKPVAKLLEAWHDGGIKQRIVHDLLRLRSRFPKLFSDGSYEPIEAVGPASDHVCAFIRRFEKWSLLVVVPAHLRLASAEAWQQTWVPMASGKPGKWMNVFEGGEGLLTNGGFCVGSFLSAIPLAALLSVED